MTISTASYSTTNHQIFNSPLAWKRPFDFVLGLFILVLLSPLFLAIAALVKLTSPGNVLFVQTRVGKDGKPFKIYKFRSMFMDAEARRAALQTGVWSGC